MREEQSLKWLRHVGKRDSPLNESPIAVRVTNFQTVGKCEGDLDKHAAREGMVRQNDSLKRARRLFDCGQSEEAAAECLELANEGMPEAMHMMGSLFLYGSGVTQSDEQALHWYARSSDSGVDEAKHCLAWMLVNGRGGAPDPVRAIQLLTSLLVEGNLSAADMLATIYLNGAAPLEPDYLKAAEYLKILADAGDAEAKIDLANLYARGEGVVQSAEMSLQLNLEAAQQGNMNAAFNAGLAFAHGRGTPVDHVLARQMYKLASDAGMALATHNLGALFANGLGGPQDFDAAMRLYILAASRGSPMSRRNMGFMCLNGEGAAASEVAALAWFLGCQPGVDPETDQVVERLRASLSSEDIDAALKKSEEIELFLASLNPKH
jgi:TPR repeat protein